MQIPPESFTQPTIIMIYTTPALDGETQTYQPPSGTADGMGTKGERLS
jgi:hypothetical protein